LTRKRSAPSWIRVASVTVDGRSGKRVQDMEARLKESTVLKRTVPEFPPKAK
jgi:hypothetical protein